MKKIILLTTMLPWMLNMFILVTNVNGQTIFQKKFTGSYNFELADGKPTSDGGYIVCGSVIGIFNDVISYLVKLDDHGDTVWTKAFEESSALYLSAVSVQETLDRGYILAGVAPTSLAPSYIYLIKTDANGDTIWTWSNINWDGAGLSAISQTIDSGYILAGYTPQNYSYLTMLDKNGSVLWNKVITKPSNDFMARVTKSVKQTADSGFILCGSYNDSSIYNYDDSSLYHDIYLIKTNVLGDTVWTKRFTTNGNLNYNNEGADAIQSTDGGYMVTGSTLSANNYWGLFAIKTDASGDTLWTRKYAVNATNCYSYSISATKDGGYILTGGCNDSQQGNHIILIKINAYGDTLWTRNFGATNETGIAVHPTQDGGYFIAAYLDVTGSSYITNGYIVKTDSLGHSGCFEYNVNWIVSSFPIMTTTNSTIDSSSATVAAALRFEGLNYNAVDSTICISSVGIDELVNFYNSISLYPNPATNQLTIHTSSFHNEAATVSIMNMLGQEALSYSLSFGEGRGEALDISKLPAGMYFVQLKSESGSVTKKFVKE